MKQQRNNTWKKRIKQEEKGEENIMMTKETKQQGNDTRKKRL